MTATEKKLGSSGIRLRTYSDAELARVVLYGRGLRKQLAQGRRRRAAADGQRRIRQEPSPSPPPPDPETLEPWPHHPLALMGFFKQYIPAEGDPHDVLASAPRPPTKNGALGAPPFAAHSAIRFRDEAMDTLNPGWEPTVSPAVVLLPPFSLCPPLSLPAPSVRFHRPNDGRKTDEPSSVSLSCRCTFSRSLPRLPRSSTGRCAPR